jgi:arginine utilization protein RocB
MLLEVVHSLGKPPCPSKLNHEWLKEEYFLQLLKDSCTPFNRSLYESTIIQFLQNLKKAKQIAIQWSKKKREKEDKLLQEVEEALASKISMKFLEESLASRLSLEGFSFLIDS